LRLQQLCAEVAETTAALGGRVAENVQGEALYELGNVLSTADQRRVSRHSRLPQHTHRPAPGGPHQGPDGVGRRRRQDPGRPGRGTVDPRRRRDRAAAPGAVSRDSGSTSAGQDGPASRALRAKYQLDVLQRANETHLSQGRQQRPLSTGQQQNQVDHSFTFPARHYSSAGTSVVMF